MLLMRRLLNRVQMVKHSPFHSIPENVSSNLKWVSEAALYQTTREDWFLSDPMEWLHHFGFDHEAIAMLYHLSILPESIGWDHAQVLRLK